MGAVILKLLPLSWMKSGTAVAKGSHQSLWLDALKRLSRDKLALSALVIVLIYALVAILSAMGLVAGNWAQEVGESYSPPPLRTSPIALLQRGGGAMPHTRETFFLSSFLIIPFEE